jgi:hypothetical protein
MHRTGEQSNKNTTTFQKNKFQQSFARINTFLSQRFQLGFYYRIKSTDNLTTSDQNNPISKSERLLIDVSHEEWKLIQINLRSENHINQYFHNNARNKNLNLRQFSQFNVRFFPGFIWDRLSVFNFDVTYNRSLNGSGSEDNGNASIWWLNNKNIGRLQNYQKSETYFIKNEYRPAAWWYLYSLFEYNERNFGLGSSELKSNYWRLSEKLDFKLSFKTRLTLQAKYFYNNQSYGRIDKILEPSGNLEYRISQNLLNIFYLLYRNRWQENGFIENKTNQWEVRYDLIFQKNPFWIFRRFELRQSLGGNYSKSAGYIPDQQYQWAASTSLDIFPVHSLIIRLRVDWSAQQNDIYSSRNTSTLMLNLKMSLKM